MTFIFNLWAIPVGIVIYLVMTGLEHLCPVLGTEPWDNFVFGGVTTLVGGICELVGIRGRFFFVPIWLFGLFFICVHLGWPGRIAFAALLAGGVILLYRAAKKDEAADWEKAQEYMARNAAPSAQADEVKFWEWVTATLFLPLWMRFTPDLCQHNLKVLQTIRQSGLPLIPGEQLSLQALEQFLTQAQTAAKSVSSDPKFQQPVAELVEKRIRDAQKQARRLARNERLAGLQAQAGRPQTTVL